MLHWIKPCVDHNRIVHVLLQSTGMHYPLSSKMSQKHFCPCFVKKYGVEEKNLQRPHSWFGLLIFEKALVFQNCSPQKEDSPITSLQLLLLMCPSWIARSEEKCSTAPLLRGLWDLNIILGVSKFLFFSVSRRRPPSAAAVSGLSSLTKLPLPNPRLFNQDLAQEPCLSAAAFMPMSLCV